MGVGEVKVFQAQDALKLFADCQTAVGEGPVWVQAEKRLYWIDVFRGEIYRKELGAAPQVFDHYKFNIGKIGGITLQADGSFLVFAAEGKVWSWRAGQELVLKAQLKEAIPSRFNDIMADGCGRVYCGVAPVEPGQPGSLWRMDKDWSFTCIEPHTAGMPNGMGFSPDRKYLYFVVTNERTIYRYEYNSATGSLTGRVPFIKVSEDEGLPDGMTVDSQGCIWSAQWDGSRLVRYSLQGAKQAEYLFPIKKITSACFGGENKSTLFVTTANHPWAADVYESSKAGAVYLLENAVSSASGE